MSDVQKRLRALLTERFGIGYWRASDEGFSEVVINEIVKCVLPLLQEPLPLTEPCQGQLVEGGEVVCQCSHGHDGVCGFMVDSESAPEAAPGPTPPRDEPTPRNNTLRQAFARAMDAYDEICDARIEKGEIGLSGERFDAAMDAGMRVLLEQFEPRQAPAEAVTVEQGWALRSTFSGSFYIGAGYYGSGFVAPLSEKRPTNNPGTEFKAVYVERRVTVREGAGTT